MDIISEVALCTIESHIEYVAYTSLILKIALGLRLGLRLIFALKIVLNS